jgi:hypothetical protein
MGKQRLDFLGVFRNSVSAFGQRRAGRAVGLLIWFRKIEDRMKCRLSYRIARKNNVAL